MKSVFKSVHNNGRYLQFCDRHVCSFQYAATRRLQLRAWPILCTGLRPAQFFLVPVCMLRVILRICENQLCCVPCNVVSAVVAKVGKLATYWNMPLFSMSAMNCKLRNPWNYGTLVRVSTTADHFATAVLMFCHHNDVCALFALFLLWSKAAIFTSVVY